MGIFSMDNTRYENNYNVIANESYSGVEGAMQILIDGARNDQALFEAMIASDMTEIDLINCNESAEVYALNEAGAGGIFERVKEFLQKMWEKLKGVILSFINKLKAKMTSDNAKLVSKYGNDVRKKTFGKNFTYKYAEPQSTTPETDLTKIKKNIETTLRGKDWASRVDKDKKLVETKVKEIERYMSSGKALKEMLALLSGAPNVTSDNFDEKFHKKMFKNEKECRGLDSGRLSNIMKALENSNEAISDAKELQSDLDEFCKDLIDKFDEDADEFASKKPEDEYTHAEKRFKTTDKDGNLQSTDHLKYSKTSWYTAKDITEHDDDFDRTTTYAVATKIATLYSKMASITQTACTKYTTAYLKEIKFAIAQDRKVFIKAVAWRESQNESYEDSSILFNAIDESVDYELSDLI